MKRLLFIFLIFPILSFAQDSFVIKAPTIVAIGEPFRVEFVANGEIKDFVAPTFEGFNVIAGPTTSSSNNITYINGQLTRSSEYTYTFVVVAEKEGNNSIGKATAKIGDKEISTSVLPIEVVREQTGNSNPTNQNNQSNSSQSNQTPKTEIAADDILIRAVPSRSVVYVGEPILVELKLYTRVQIAGINGAKLAAFNGFWNQELEDRPRTQKRETYNGKIYDTQVLKEFLVFPQKSGKLQIESMSIEAIVAVISNSPNSGSLFDSFFGGGRQIVNVPKNVVSPSVAINVNALPSGAPESFNGAVGSFTIKGTINENKISANTSNALVLTINGSGNFPLISAPELELPTSFELYPSKTKDNYQTTTSNIVGSKTIDYPFIARAEGDFDLKGIEFTYFNPSIKQYVTVKTDDFNLSVLKDVTNRGATAAGIINPVTKEELKILGEDIHFIKVGDSGLTPIGRFFIGSWLYILILSLLSVLFVGIILYMKKRIKELRDTVKLRNKKANKVAIIRLKKARKFKNDSMENEFYSEMLKALTGYIGDKLNIEVSRLSKDTINDELKSRNVDTVDIEQLLNTISDCEFAQYAPMSTVKMSDVYQRTLQLIGRLESKL